METEQELLKELLKEINEQIEELEQSIANWINQIKFGIKTGPHTIKEYQKILKVTKFVKEKLNNSAR